MRCVFCWDLIIVLMYVWYLYIGFNVYLICVLLGIYCKPWSFKKTCKEDQIRAETQATGCIIRTKTSCSAEGMMDLCELRLQDVRVSLLANFLLFCCQNLHIFFYFWPIFGLVYLNLCCFPGVFFFQCFSSSFFFFFFLCVCVWPLTFMFTVILNCSTQLTTPLLSGPIK